MYILEQDNGSYEVATAIAVGRNAFSLAEYAIKFGGLAGWSLQAAEEDGYVIRGSDGSARFWIKPILEISAIV
jgi:hypothetical protein